MEARRNKPAGDLEPIEVRRYRSVGETVVVLHGGPGAPGCAAGLARALAGEFVVLEPLQRRSGRVALTVARHVEDLAMVAPRPAILVGSSWGAMLGLSFAAKYPERVSGVVLVGCGTYDEGSRAVFRRELDRRLGEVGRREVEGLRARLAGERDRARRDAIFGGLGDVFMRAESFDRVEGEDDPADRLPADEAGNAETWADALR